MQLITSIFNKNKTSIKKIISSKRRNFNCKFNQNTPPLERMPEYTQKMIQVFLQHFSQKGYTMIPSVAITSGIDPTVRLIGSHVSPMKNYFIENKIPKNGLIMSQPCIRTHNLKKIFDDSSMPAWGSYFISLGALVIPEKISELCKDSLEYLLSILNIPAENLILRINFADSDLYSLAKKFAYLGISYDDSTMPEKYYRHKIGIEGIWGRNFNYAIKKDGILYDIGNLIILESTAGKLGVELALGTSTILKAFFSLPHVNSANPIFGIEKINNPLRFKFEDAIITSSILFSEGLIPSASDSKGRTLRSYLRAIMYFKNKFKIQTKSIAKMMWQFENSQKINHSGSNFIVSYIDKIEKEILLQNSLSNEEELILLEIKQNFT